MTEGERQNRVKELRAELAGLNRLQCIEQEEASEPLMERLPKMSQDQILDEMAHQMFTITDVFNLCRDTKSKPLIGGTFDQGTWRLYSTLMPFSDAGLHSLKYWVADPDKLLCIGSGETKSEALAKSRETMSFFGRHRLSWLILTRKQELDDVRAAERSEQQRQFAARELDLDAPPREKAIPKRRLAIFNKSSGKCHYCATELDLRGRWHIEHKMPRALLGGSEVGNLVASCTKCNHAKRDQTDLEFMSKRRGAA